MFTVVNAILLRPLPFRDPGRLFIVSHVPARGMLGGEPGMFDRQYVSYRATTRAFEATTSYNVFPATLTRAGEPARISTVAVTEGFFRVLGTLPAIGRAFTADDHVAGANKTVILSDAIWHDRFSADPQAIGRTFGPRRRAAHDRRRDAARLRFSIRRAAVVPNALRIRSGPHRAASGPRPPRRRHDDDERAARARGLCSSRRARSARGSRRTDGQRDHSAQAAHRRQACSSRC